MNKSSSVKEIASALNAFQKGMRSIKEESENPFFKSKYADLADIWRAIREPLAQNGLSVSQGGRVVDGNAVLVTTIMHVSGEWIEGEYPIVSKDNTPQGLGSGNTYARRYALSGMLGLTTDVDDDGEGATGRTKMPAEILKQFDSGLGRASTGENLAALGAWLEKRKGLFDASEYEAAMNALKEKTEAVNGK